ncbi:hypothetical protein NIES4103_14030 [Nostoc sp. NIES-4103]|nr:hypothetical protein NIES4103_14030 [Nostoc sp. NIES-4103]
MGTSKLLELNPQDLDGCGDIMGSIRNRQIDGILIKDFISPDIALSRGESLMENPSLMRSSSCPYGRIYARTIIGMGNQSEQYFEDAQVFRTECERFFGSQKNFETHLAQLLAKIAGDRKISLPLGPGGTPYSPATIRWVDPGGTIAPHCEKIYFKAGAAAFELINQIAVADTIFSFFMVMTKPEAGGELVLYDFNWQNQNGNGVGKQTNTKYLESHCNPTPIPISEGDLIIFNAGQIWHQISEVKGTMPRITIGGFISFSKDDKTLYYFS